VDKAQGVNEHDNITGRGHRRSIRHVVTSRNNRHAHPGGLNIVRKL